MVFRLIFEKVLFLSFFVNKYMTDIVLGYTERFQFKVQY